MIIVVDVASIILSYSVTSSKFIVLLLLLLLVMLQLSLLLLLLLLQLLRIGEIGERVTVEHVGRVGIDDQLVLGATSLQSRDDSTRFTPLPRHSGL